MNQTNNFICVLLGRPSISPAARDVLNTKTLTLATRSASEVELSKHAWVRGSKLPRLEDGLALPPRTDSDKSIQTTIETSLHEVVPANKPLHLCSLPIITMLRPFNAHNCTITTSSLDNRLKHDPYATEITYATSNKLAS